MLLNGNCIGMQAARQAGCYRWVICLVLSIDQEAWAALFLIFAAFSDLRVTQDRKRSAPYLEILCLRVYYGKVYVDRAVSLYAAVCCAGFEKRRDA